jgi:peptidoglycan/LPS O-acetylase OafA/YrhL
VRGFALLLGVAFHATVSFVPAPVQIWPVEDSRRSVTLAVVFFVTHVFRMTTFFLIAGFFAHLSLHRRGVRAFIGDRLKRIALPLVVGWPILFASIVAVSIWAAVSAQGPHASHAPPPAWPALPAFPLTHLWFLYVVLELYAIALILRALVAAVDRAGRLAAVMDRLTNLMMANPLGPALLAAPVGVAFAIDPQWLMWSGARTPDSSLLTNPQAFIAFGVAFGFGWALHRQTVLLDILRRRWALNLTLALAFVGAGLVIAGATPLLTSLPDLATRIVGAAVYALAMWTSTFAAIGLALRFLSGFSAARRYIADASYWIYLVHLPVVLAMQQVVCGLDWPWPACCF